MSDDSNTTVLVTGGGGFVGKRLVEKLLARGDEVRTLARGDYPELTEMGAEHLRGDIADKATVDAALTGVGLVFHVASLVKPFGDPKEFDRVNIEGTQNIIEGCKKHGVSRLVFTSTPSVIHDGNDAHGIDESKPYPDSHLCDYFRSKAEAERRVLAADNTKGADDVALRTCSLRPHGIYGPGDTSLFPLLIQRAQSGRLRIIGDGDTKVDWTYIDNAVHAHLLAADALDDDAPAGGKAYFIADGNPQNPWTMFNGVLQELGLPQVNRKVSLGIAKFAGGMMEKAWRVFGLKGEPPATRAMASVLGTSHWFDLSAAERDLGYTPLVTTEEGLKRTVPWLKAEMESGSLAS